MDRKTNPLEDDEAMRIRRDMADTRAEMTGTLDELHGKLNPTVLKEQAIEQFHDAKTIIRAEMSEVRQSLKAELKKDIEEAKGALRKATIGNLESLIGNARDAVVETVKHNPIPSAMVGLGLGLMVVRILGNQRAVSDGLQSAKQVLDQYATTAKEKSQRVEGYLEQTFHDNPWVVGAAVLAAGTAIGLAIPISRREDQWMGRTRDGLVRQASEKAKGAIEKVEDAARRATENASGHNGEAQSRTNPPSPPQR